MVGGGRGSYDYIMAEESSLVCLSDGSRKCGTRDDYYRHCGGQGEKILMIGKMRITKIIKINFIIASAISLDPSQKSLPIPIANPILPLSLKTRI